MRVLEIAAGADDQHPRAVARICRLERDAFRGKNEIEGVDAHDCQMTKRFKPCFNRYTLKFISRPIRSPDSLR